MKKKDSCKIHIKRRFKKRFGLDINRFDIQELTKNILNGDNVLYEDKQTNRVTAYTLIFKKKRCVVVFDRMRKVPITVLTPKMYEEGRVDENDEEDIE